MLNFMGLGFSFAGKDAGLTKAIDSALGAVSKFHAGIAGVSEELGELAEKGRNPTEPFEAKMIANNVMLTSLGANLGKTGKELKDFTGKSQSLALAMNRGEAETGTAIGQFERMKSVMVEMVETGIDSAKTLLKVSEASGVHASVFADSSMQLAKMRGMTKEAGADILDTMTAAGKAMGDVAGSLGDAASRTALLQKRSALLAQGFKGIGIEEFSKQIDATAVSFQKATGASAATARAFGTGLAESIQDSAQAFKELTVGVGTDIPEGLKGLALTTGDIGTAFSNMEDGPEGFMKTMRNLTKNMGGDKEKLGQLMTWIQGQTGKAFGPERSKEIVNMLMLTTDATLEQGKAVKTATGALKKYGEEAYVNGRTAAESMELSENQFRMTVRNANRTADKFAAAAGASFRSLSADIAALADPKNKGSVGDLTRGLVDLHQKGLVGLFPEDLQGKAVAMGGMFKMLGETLKGVWNPLSGLESLMVLFTVAMKDAFDGIKGKGLTFFDKLGMAFEKVGDRAVAWFSELPKRITGWIDSASGALGKALTGGKTGKWGAIFGRWWEAILKTFTAMGPIIDRLKGFASDFWEAFTLTMSVDPTKASLGTKLGVWLSEMWETVGPKLDQYVWQPIKKFGKEFWDALTTGVGPAAHGDKKQGAATSIGIWMHGVIEKAIDLLKEKLPDLLASLFKMLGIAMAKGAMKVGSGVLSGLGMDKAAGYLDLAGNLFDTKTEKPDAGAKSKGKIGSHEAARSAGPLASFEMLTSTTKEAAEEQKQRDAEALDIAKRHLYLAEQAASHASERRYSGTRDPVSRAPTSKTMTTPNPAKSREPLTGMATVEQKD